MCCSLQSNTLRKAQSQYLNIRLLVFTLLLYCAYPQLTQASDSLPTMPSLEQLAEQYGPETRFTIMRKGKKIGTHILTFDKQDDSLRVNVESNIRVTILKIPVFKFRYTATEIWRDNQLSLVSATTVEDGKSKTVGFDAALAEAPATFATNHWHRGVLSVNQIFNTITGDVSQVSLTEIGAETFDNGSGTIEATRFRYSGDIEADVWYDNEGLWARLQFKGEDSSTIDYIRD
ncbi:MAG: DUF6134 family protein [Granulosicoccus sp.]